MDTMIVKCRICSALVNAEELYSYKTDYEEELDEGQVFNVKETYALLKCPKCGQPILYLTDSMDNEGVVYPKEEQINIQIPPAIRTVLQEALTCFDAKAFTSTAIMCRKALEGVCEHHGVKDKTLDARIDKLKELGLIEGQLYEWATEVRGVGNQAAHDVRIIVSRDDARDIMDFTIALNDYLFTFKDKYKQFKERRAKRVPYSRSPSVPQGPN